MLRKPSTLLAVLGMSVVLMGAGAPVPRTTPNAARGDATATVTFPPSPGPSASLNEVLSVAGVLTGDAATGTPTPTPTPTPMESIGGETGTPSNVTPPPTSLVNALGGSAGSGMAMILLICLVVAAMGFAAARAQRRSGPA